MTEAMEDVYFDSKYQWAQEARNALAVAESAIEKCCWRIAYMLCGHAVECALKARIMHEERLNSFPDRKDRPQLYVHDPEELLRIVKLQPIMENEVLNLTAVGTSWLRIKDFATMRRYPEKMAFPIVVAENAVDGLKNLGLMEWILTGIR